MAENLCDEPNVSGCAKCPHHRARGIEEWIPPPQHIIFMHNNLHQNILVMAGDLWLQGAKALKSWTWFNLRLGL